MSSSETNAAAPQAVIVSGAASGIGLATTEMLCRRGTFVLGLDRAGCPRSLSNVDNLQWVRGDVTSQDTWDDALRVLLERDPSGDVSLISCAADLVTAPFLETSLDDWRRLYDINVRGVIRGMRTVMPRMLERKRGAIAVVCSVNSYFAENALSAYSTTKSALLQVVRSAALEYARHGLRINAVCPGAVDTPLFRRALEELGDPDVAREAVVRRTPTASILKPAEIAAVLCFLISDAATGLSGAAVTVDGGLTTAYDFDSSASPSAL
jgi:NAD(P)-dependent dehydrogenase (short-subunit alcohol dehydrogenase family)